MFYRAEGRVPLYVPDPLYSFIVKSAICVSILDSTY